MSTCASLICPEHRPGFEFLRDVSPLALLPFGGKSLLDHALTELAGQGITHVALHVSDRPDLIRLHVLTGQRWGLTLEIHPVVTEPTVAEICERISPTSEIGERAVFLLDRIPLSSTLPLFSDPNTYFNQLVAFLPAAADAQIGFRERSPGIWIGIGSRVPKETQLYAPCWIGRNVYLERNVTVGPRAIVEDQCLIDEGASIVDSQIGQGSYIGNQTDVHQSLAWGAHLLNWKTGTGQIIQDPFILAKVDADDHHNTPIRPSIPARLVAISILVLLIPLIAILTVFLRTVKGQAFLKKQAVVPFKRFPPELSQEFQYHDLNIANLRLQRLPRIWSVVKGDMTWVGNPPLTSDQAKRLTTEFDSLWLTTGCGVISLGDCFETTTPENEDAKAHAAFFATQGDSSLRRKILAWFWFNRQKYRTPTRLMSREN